MSVRMIIQLGEPAGKFVASVGFLYIAAMLIWIACLEFAKSAGAMWTRLAQAIRSLSIAPNARTSTNECQTGGAPVLSPRISAAPPRETVDTTSSEHASNTSGGGRKSQTINLSGASPIDSAISPWAGLRIRANVYFWPISCIMIATTGRHYHYDRATRNLPRRSRGSAKTLFSRMARMQSLLQNGAQAVGGAGPVMINM